jgi:hypothetical protein
VISLQKWVGGIITAFSAWTIFANIIFFRGDPSIFSIILAGVSLVLFFVSIFVIWPWVRVGHVICIMVVAIFSITSEPDRIWDVLAGCFFMMVSVALSFAYDFFDKNPVPIIIIAVLSLTFAFTITTGNVATGAGISFASSSACGILWAIVHVKVSRMQAALKEAIQRADDFKQALKERMHDGEIH